MARPRSENYDAVRNTILRRAAALFAAKSYERSSITDLTQACRLSRGALYHYFGSKDAILFALLDGHVRELLRRLEEQQARACTASEHLAHVVETIVVCNAASPNEQILLLNELGSVGKRERASIVAHEKKIVAIVANALVRLDGSGRITGANRTVYTMMLLGIVNFAHTWYDPAGDVKPAQFARMTTDVFFSGLFSGDDQTRRPSRPTVSKVVV